MSRPPQEISPPQPSGRGNAPQSLFWPMRGKVAPVQYDILCRKCGYNLRGLSDRRCPECGEAFEPFEAGSGNIPWAQRRWIGFLDAFWHTVHLVLFDTAKLSKEAWNPHEPDEREAIAFRRLAILHAWVPITVLWIAAAKWVVPGPQLPYYIAAGAVVTLIWARWTSLLPVKFMRRQALPLDRYTRAVALSHYTSAALAVSAIHLLPLVASAIARMTGDRVIFRAVVMVWAAMVVWHIAQWLWSWASFSSGVMNWNRSMTFVFAILTGFLWVVASVVLLVLLPLGAGRIIARLLQF
jgi:hypothetical protein